MVEVSSCAYFLTENNHVAIHRVRVGERVISALYTECPTPTFRMLDHADAAVLGVDLVVDAPDHAHRYIEAIRPGLGSSDDELVAKLASWDNGRIDWLVPILPTPRGSVIAAFMLSLHEMRTTCVGVAPRSELKQNGRSDTDDSAVLVQTFDFDADQAAARRLRSWTFGSWTLIAGEPDEEDIAHLGTAVEARHGCVGEVLLRREDTHPRYFSWRFSPLRSDESWEALPADLHRVAEAAKSAIWDTAHPTA